MSHEDNRTYRQDRSWSDGCYREVVAILTRHLGAMVEIRPASEGEDAKQATDLVFSTATGTVAARVRDNRRTFRHWTIRVSRASGVKTEMAKLKEGFARWYIYAWFGDDDRVADYVIIDLDAVRAAGLLDVKRKQFTADRGQTYFVGIEVVELREAKCLLVDECKSDCPEPQPNYRPPPSIKSPVTGPPGRGSQAVLKQKDLFVD